MKNPVAFTHARAMPKLPRSGFDISVEAKFDCEFGQLIPIFHRYAMPGDVFKGGPQIVVRGQPSVYPYMHEVNVFTHYFFWPYRLVGEVYCTVDANDNKTSLFNWEKYITGGPLGNDAQIEPVLKPIVAPPKLSLWDYFAWPLSLCNGVEPNAWPTFAYAHIYNEFYRDQNLIEPITFGSLASAVAFTVAPPLQRAWEKDYFASALPFQQRGPTPLIPVGGPAPVTSGNNVLPNGTHALSFTPIIQGGNIPTFGDNGSLIVNSGSNVGAVYASNGSGIAQNLGLQVRVGNGWTADLSAVPGITPAELRVLMGTELFQEFSGHTGSRYTEHLKSLWHVSPTDERLQRPEYIGGSKSPVIVREVVQTSETDSSAQGNLAGHTLSTDINHTVGYHVKEHGLIIGIMSIMPRSAYQQGVHREMLRRSRFDYPAPMFMNFSDQGILNGELYADGNAQDNNGIFGYTGIFNELRHPRSVVCGNLRDNQDYIHLGRQFTTRPQLNQQFITCDYTADNLKRVFAVTSEPSFIVTALTAMSAYRHLPLVPTPGRMDHLI